MARKLAKKNVDSKVEGMRPWDDPKAIAQGIMPDRRPWYAQLEPAEGVPAWEALYHFIDADRSERFYRLDLMGYGDEGNRHPDWPDEELADFNSKHFHWKMEKAEFEHLLYWRLRKGKLIARGFSSTSALDAPRQEIAGERWADLELDIRKSKASGPGIDMTQILVFDPSRLKKRSTKSMVRVSAARLRAWYNKRITEFSCLGKTPSREDDDKAARKMFGKSVSRSPVRTLRRELAPQSWTQKGRRKKPTTQSKQ